MLLSRGSFIRISKILESCRLIVLDPVPQDFGAQLHPGAQEHQYPVQVVTGSDETLDVASMAELLFGEATATHKYAAHKLLSEDRTYFKQTNRSPARFQPRLEKEVRSFIIRAEALAKVRLAAGCSLYMDLVYEALFNPLLRMRLASPL